MGLPEYLSSLNLSPEVASQLTAQYGPPAPNQSDAATPPPDAFGAPSADEMARYGAKPADIAAAQRFNGASGPPQAATNPTAADPKWDPATEATRTNEEAGRKERAAATPQGPAGPDGFPTYRDLGTNGPAMQQPMTGPQRTIAAHWSPATRGETTLHGIDEAKLRPGQDYRDEAHIEGKLSNQGQLAAAEQQGMADAVYSAAHAKASMDAAADFRRIQNERALYVQNEKQKLETMAQAAQQKVDPDAAKGSAGAQLFATIAVALGQYGASINGGPNTAMQMVNADIDRKIDAQKTNIANAGKAHDREQSLYRQNLEAFGDKERAVLATKLQYLDQVKAMADQQYAGAKHTMNEANYHAMNQKLLDERAQTLDQFGVLTADKHTTQSQDHYIQAQTVGGPGAGAKGKEKLYVPSLGGYARDEESARKLNGHGALRTQINEDLHEIHSLLDEAKGLNSVTDYGRMQEVRQRIDALKHGVLQKTTVLADQGAMSKGDQSVAEARSALESVDPQLKTDSQIKRMQKGLVGVAKSHQRDARLEGESYGIQLGREGYAQTPTGPEPRAQLAGANKVVTKKTEGIDDLLEKPKGEPEK